MSEQRSAVAEFEIRGEWWLPENEPNRVPGILRYKAGDWVKLELDKPLTDQWRSDEPNIRTYSLAPTPIEVALGKGKDGTSCTLVDGYSLGTSISASSLLLNRHFARKSDIRFTSAELNLTHLEEWSEHSPVGLGFPLALPVQGDIEAPFSVQFPYRRKKLFEFEIPSRSSRIELYSGIGLAWRTYRSLTLNHATLIFVEPATAQDLAWYRRFFLDCTRLFSFLVGSRVYRTSTVCTAESTSEDIEPTREVELYDQKQSAPVAEETHPAKMPLPFRFLEHVAPSVFDKWFATADELGPVHQLLLETLPPNDMGLESVLLRLAQAVEVFFRRSVRATYVTPEEYRQYYNRIVRAFPDEMADTLRDRLKNYLIPGNEYSLRSVVKRLIEDLEEPVRAALRVESPNRFASLVANTRNSLTHHTAPNGPTPSTAQEYYEMNKRLRALLYGVLAKSLGFDGLALVHCVQNVLAYG